MTSSLLGRLRPAGCAAALLLLTWSLPATTAETGTQAPATDARAMGAPLAHEPLRPRPLPNAQPTDADWRAAHTAVGAFPRGHADIVAWEAQQAASAAKPPAGAAVHGGAGAQKHRGHHGHPHHGGHAMPPAGPHGLTHPSGGAR